jgi:2-polyprenyl-6-methoxyphenol hydroxylase-like FAD-dependent oxidoreductase
MDLDVIIVWARVASASLAMLLGSQGRRVLLVDRDRFPSDTLSTHLLQPPAVEMLARLGVLADVEASGLRRLGRLRTYLGGSLLEGAIRGPGAYALCARRAHFDHVLDRHALRRDSVELLEGTRAEGLLWKHDRVAGVHLKMSGNRALTVRAPIVVGADGKHSAIDRWVNARTHDEVPALRPMYYAYYRGDAPLPEPAVEVFYRRDWIGFVLPMEPGIDCLVLELQPADFEAFRADLPGRFEDAFLSLWDMRGRMAGAVREGNVRGTRGVENYFRVPYGPGWALTGDAAYCKDPGTGIEDAFRQSFLLAGALGAVLDGADWDATLDDYHRGRDAMMQPAYRSTLTFTRTPSVSEESLSWLPAVLANAGHVRLVGQGFPDAVRAGGVFPPSVLQAIERSAGRFAAAAWAATAGPRAA